MRAATPRDSAGAARAAGPPQQWTPLPEIVLVIGVLLLVTWRSRDSRGGRSLGLGLAVLAGIVLDAAGAVDVTRGVPGVAAVVELASSSRCSAIGMIVERKLLVGHRARAARALAIAMPLTAVFVGVAAKLLFPELDWVEAFLIGAIVAPNDPVITSSVVAARGVHLTRAHAQSRNKGSTTASLCRSSRPHRHLGGRGVPRDRGRPPDRRGLRGAADRHRGRGSRQQGGEGRVAAEVDGKFQGVYALGIGLIACGISKMTIGNGFIATSRPASRSASRSTAP